jgi:TRAP-type C4-dicarboxylate transport system permease small subunit
MPDKSVASAPSLPDDLAPVDRLLAPLRTTLRKIGLLLLFVMIALPALQVFLREVAGKPFVGAEELARFMLICVVFITLPYVIASGSSVRMEEILAALPPGLQRPVRVLCALASVTAFTIAAWSVGVATFRNLENATPTLGIPYWLFFCAAFIGFLVAALESAVQLWKVLRRCPLYVSFAEELPPDEAELEAAIVGMPTETRK